jgi:hypothetical protein
MDISRNRILCLVLNFKGQLGAISLSFDVGIAGSVGHETKRFEACFEYASLGTTPRKARRCGNEGPSLH